MRLPVLPYEFVEDAFSKRRFLIDGSGGLFSKGPAVRGWVAGVPSCVLGFSTICDRSSYTLIPATKCERVITIANDREHVMLAATLKKVFCWGGGQNGSLGQVAIEGSGVQLEPKCVFSIPEASSEVIVQICGIYRSSALLTSHGRLYTWGCSRMGAFHGKSLPVTFPAIPQAALKLDIVYIHSSGIGKLVVVTRQGDVLQASDALEWAKSENTIQQVLDMAIKQRQFQLNLILKIF